MIKWPRMILVVSLGVAGCCLAACGEKGDHAHEHGHEHDHDHTEEGHDHVHTAPHGGALVVLGEEFAHLELVLDPSTATLTAYALDGEAGNAVRLAQDKIEISVDAGTAGGSELALAAVASSLTGETVGDTSQFSIQADGLRGASTFTGTIKSVSIKGQEFKDVAFKYPEGNE